MEEKKLIFETVHDIEKAKKIWNELSPHETIDDEWEFRYAFFQPLSYELYFIVAYDGEHPVGVLPLQRNNREGLQPPYIPDKGEFLEFFGGDDTDDNRAYWKPGYEKYEPEILKYINEPTIMAPLKEEFVGNLRADWYTDKYFLDLRSYKTYEDYIDAHFTGESRGKFKRSIRSIYKNYQVEIRENEDDAISLLSSFNVKRFGEKSSFRYHYRKNIFEDLAQSYEVITLTLLINGTKQAVSYGIKYKDFYLAMNIGVNDEINNLGKLLIMLQIQKAIDLGCTTYDAGKGDSGWKEIYKLKKIPQYKREFNLSTETH